MINKRERLNGISLLRLIATLGIMFYHIGLGHYYFKFIKPALGTHLFLCISAFLFMYTTQAKTASVFLKNRLIRIVPLYAILTVLTYIASKFIGSLNQEGTEVSQLIKSLLFIPYSRGSFKSGNVVRPLVGPAWTLYYDIWFSVMFACSMKFSKKWRGLISACACIIAYSIGMILPKEFAVSNYLYNLFWFDFIAGIGAYYVWSYFSKKTCTSLSKLSGIVAVLSILALYLGPNYNILHPIESFFILTSTLLFAAQKPVAKFVNWFSNMSYSFYLIHYYVIIAIGKVLDLTVFSIKTVFGAVAIFIVTLLMSVCSYKIIETWLCNMLKRWFIDKRELKCNYQTKPPTTGG